MDSISMAVNMESIPMLGQKHGSSKLFLPFSNNLFLVRKVSCFPLNSVPSKPSKYDPLKEICNQTCYSQDSTRKFKKLPPSQWTDHFDSLHIDISEMDMLRKENDVLKTKVKNVLMSFHGIDSTKKRILMIYLLVSLGLAYHFEDAINETLQEGFKRIEDMLNGEDDLYTVSIIFWVFRSYGHNISSDIFKRFKGSNGNFKESLSGDVKGMLSLYEASHLGTTKCYIMDEALSFTSSHLKSLAACETCPPHLSKHIRNSLLLSQHWNMEVLVPIEYISFYEQEKDHEEMLLRFAKISFKLLQLQYHQELKVITKWYKDLELTSKLPPYFRDRIVEHYFIILAVFYKPKLSRSRMLLTKFYTTLGIQDDTFDRYVSLPEAESLANSFIRWSLDDDMDKHPDYLKSVFHFILDIFEEFERELGPQGKSDSVNATREEFKKVVKASVDLERWAQAGNVPSFDEYMEVGEVEITVIAALSCIFMSMENTDSKKAYEWLKTRPRLVKAVIIKGRLMNDLTGFEDDMSRGYVTNAINCYMKQYGVTKNEAFRELYKMVEMADKTINEEFLTTGGVEHCILKAAIDLSRMIQLTYNVDEGLTHPEGKIMEYMTSLFVDHIRL